MEDEKAFTSPVAADKWLKKRVYSATLILCTLFILIPKRLISTRLTALLIAV